MLGMGTIKTLLSKLMYGIQTRGIDGSVHSFEARSRPSSKGGRRGPFQRLRVRLCAPRGSCWQATRPGQRGPPGLAFLRCRTAGQQPLRSEGSQAIGVCSAHGRNHAAYRALHGGRIALQLRQRCRRRLGRRRSAQRVAMTFWPSRCCSEPRVVALFQPFALRRSLGTCV
jgi:hypothetical protein